MISTVFFPRVTDQFQEQYNIPIQLLEYGSIRARTLVDNEQLDVAMANMDFYNLDKYNSYVMMKTDMSTVSPRPTVMPVKKKLQWKC